MCVACRKKRGMGRLFFAILFAALGAVAIFRFGISFDLASGTKRLLEGLGDMGAYAPAAFVLAYVVTTVLLVPGSLLTMGAGALFGILWGTVYVSFASTIGAFLSFLIGRYFARAWIERKMLESRRFASLDESIGREGWKIVFLARLSPVFPFNILNYALGLTRVPAAHYLFASWIGMLPGTLLYVYVGALAGDIARMSLEGRERTSLEWVLYVLGLVATVVVTAFVTRLARNAMKSGELEDESRTKQTRRVFVSNA